jgi:hypothetical protein
MHLVNWKTVCSSKSLGGLGVLNLGSMNDALLSKWLWNLENANGLWQRIIAGKYIKGKPLISVNQRQTDSHFWKKLLNLRESFFKYCKMAIGNGRRTSFWKNFWIGDGPLALSFPILFDLTSDKDITVYKVMSSNFEALSFRRRMTGNLQELFDELVALCSKFNLSSQEDKPIWRLGNKGFTVNYLYKKNSLDQIKVPYRFLWKSKLPQKIKVFLWLVIRNKILTKDNLRKRNWKGSDECCFCGGMESIDHLFFKCSVAKFVWRVVQIALNLDYIPKNIDEVCDSWMKNPKNKMSNLLIFGCGALFWAIWRTRNDWFFGEKSLIDPANIIFLCCFWLDSWAIRQKEKEKKMVVQGSQLIRKIISEAMSRAFGWCPRDRRISG